MKKIFLLLTLVVCISYISRGQVLFVENFDYTVGDLLTAHGWTAHSGTANAEAVTAASIYYTGYVSSGVGNETTLAKTGMDVNHTFTQQTSGTVYAAFLVNVSFASATGDYFFHIGAATIGNTFHGRIFAKADPGNLNNIAFGISKSGAVTTAIFSPYTYSLGTTYLIVLRYQINPGALNDVPSIYINPPLNSTEPTTGWYTATDMTLADLANIGSVALRQGDSNNGTACKIDGIRVGLTWSETIDNSVVAPTVQATTVVFNNVTSSSLNVAWTPGNGDSRAVFMKQANTGTAAPADNTTYTANTAFGSGTEITGTGWYCIYNGTGTNNVDVTGLSASTDYIVMACEYKGAAGAEKYNINTATGNPNFTTTSAAVSPVLTTTALGDFGNVCINATAGPGNFTIDGTNLTAADVTVAALEGYTYCTTSDGTYATSLTLTQSGGTYSQIIYVKFSPTLVQSYNGNIVVSGGGALSVNTAATGAGINTLPSVTTTAPATDITNGGATCSGDVTAIGCQPVTERGICYGTASGPTIAGTHNVEPGTTGPFSSVITGLNASTLYHFRAYATSSAGTAYGTDQTFTTLALNVPVATAATDVTSSSFTANWEAVPGASGYYIDVYTTSAGTFASDLIISEYLEGSGNNKYIELYNGTGIAKDLSDYKLQLYANGSTATTNDVVLSGTLLSGQTIVYRNSLSIIYTGTSYANAAVNFNGDDAVALYKISASGYADIFGTIGEDPGDYWISGTYMTKDKTLVRKAEVTGGVTVNPAPGFPTLSTEWDQYATDDITHLGAHTFNGASVTYVLGNFDVGNVLSYNVTGLAQNTQYHYIVRAYSGPVSSGNSNVIDVMTIPATELTVTTGLISAKTSTTATANGFIDVLGTENATARGFCWDLATNPDPDINDFFVEETGSFEIGPFSNTLSTLLPSTIYKYRAYAKDNTGTYYGSVQTFTTLKAEPTNHATAFMAGTTTTSTIPLTWLDATGDVLPDGYIIKGSAVSYAAIADPVDGVPEVNSLLVHNIPYAFNGYTFLTLTPNTTYYFKIYSYSNSGTGIDYKVGTELDPTPEASATTEALPIGALLYEPFDYPAGEFIGGNTVNNGGSSNNWVTHSNGSTNTGTINIYEGSLSYTGLEASVGNKTMLPGTTTIPRDINRAIPTNTNSIMYFSFLLNVVDTTQLAISFSDNSYFIHFANTSGANAGTFYGRLHIKKFLGQGKFHLGIQNTTGGTPTQTELSTDLFYGTTYLVVVKYDYNGTSPDIATLWVNPSSLGGDEPAGSVSNNSGTATTPAIFGAICLRNASATPKAEIDEIRIGSTWADVTPPGILYKTLTVNAFMEGLYNSSLGTMNESQGTSGPQFGTGIADQVTVELHDATAPYDIAPLYPAFTGVNLSTSGALSIDNIPVAEAGSYYIVLKAHNSIETWSSAPVSFAGAGPITYDFTTAASQAYGNNLKQVGTVYAIWGGDANQDGIVDGADLSQIFNASMPPALLGYNPEDVNGDGIVDGADMSMIFNNSMPPPAQVYRP